MGVIRTFVAVEASAEQRGHAAQLIERLKHAEAHVKWVAAENLHWTLNFLGNVDDREVHNVCRAVSESVSGFEPFELTSVGAGAFPDARRPRTVWTGVSAGTEHVVSLQQAIEAAVQPLGFPPEARRFHPHLTLGRVRGKGPQTQQLGELIAEHAKFSVGKVIVDQVVVFSSRLDKSGPRYTPLAHVDLA